MKSIDFKIVIFFITATMITACNDDFLNTKPLTEFSEIDVWNDPVLAEAFVNDIYPGIGQPFQYVMNASYSGEAYSKKNVDTFNKCNISPDNLGGWINEYSDGAINWSPLYKKIRACNIFLEQVDKIPFDNTLTDGKTLKDRLTGEIHFLNAYFYYYLTSLYGGVPLIKNSFTLTENFEVPRNSYSECIKYVADECDLAASLLPTVQTGKNKGRATKGAALALKSRVLLYAASDLHNTVVFPGYSNPELIGYTDGNRQNRWKAAKDAAKAVIDLGIYRLYKAVPNAGDDVSKNIVELINSMGHSEDIFVRYYTTQSKKNQLGLYNYSNGYHGWGGNNPLGNLVDKYEMIDGTSFDWTNPSHKSAPYVNRDPRFYASILYEGAKWRSRAPDVAPYDPVGVLQVGTYEKWNSQTNKIEYTYGVDSRKTNVIEPGKGTFTGYNMRKFLDPAVDGQYYADVIPWRFIRYAEILLNYAEACIELGQEDEARQYLNMVRKRAGMPDITQSGVSLRNRYRNERTIEFAFEGQRFFDVRRWVTGADAYGPNHGVNVVYKLNPDHTTATVPTITDMVFFNGAWNDKAYFFPFTRDEVNKDPAIIQNPGYQ